MTRKRKNVQENEEEQPKKSFAGFENYGYNTEKQNESGDRDGTRSFPEKKNNFNEGGKRRRERNGREGKKDYGANDFEKQYGVVGEKKEWTQQADEEPKIEVKEEYGYDEKYGNGEKYEDRNRTGEFPKEIVGYLRNIEQIKKQEGRIEDFILEKCAEEVVGQETTLLEWTEAAVVVESVFGSCSLGASLFLTSVSRLKHKKMLDLFFGGASARTIENLIYKLCPIQSVDHCELIAKFTDLLCDNWSDAVTSQSSAFLLRSIIRVSCGLNGKAQKGEVEEKPKYANGEVKGELKNIFEKIANMAFDENLNNDLIENPVCSLVIQDVIAADLLCKTKKSDDFVTTFLEKDPNGEKLRTAWQGKNSSRIWEKIMENCREETRSIVWMGAISGNVSDMANHQFANFPLQKLIGNVTSLELATDIMDEISPSIVSYLISDKSGVGRAAISCAAKHESVQDQLIKQLRLHYRASKETNKKHFMINILTNNAFDGTHFDIEKSTVHGSLLIGELLQFSKIKTLSACFEDLTAEQIRKMCSHKIASRTIQAVITSPTLPETIKSKVVNSFSNNQWEKLISDVYGSHVFEKIWDFVQVKRKQEIMKVLVGIHNSSKQWKFAMFRCDSKLFRSDRKAWIDKMKKWKGT